MSQAPAGSVQPGLRARLQVLDAVEDRIDVVQRFPREVHLRDQALHDARGEYREMDVRRAHPVVVAGIGIGAGLDAAKSVAAVVGRELPAEGLEVGIRRLGRDVVRVLVLAAAVRLPDLDQRLADRLSVLVEHLAAEGDRLAFGPRATGHAAGDVVVARLDQPQREERPQGLRWRDDANGLRRRALLVHAVALDELQALRVDEARRVRPVGFRHGAVSSPSRRCA